MSTVAGVVNFTRTKIGVLGGTFDPIHHGHLRLALELKQQLKFTELRLMPCHQPVHREQPQVSADMRAEMIRLALANCPELILDEHELKRDKPSYTFDTLCDLRKDLGEEVSLSWIMGTDAFVALDKWHRWEELLDYAHLIVIERPGFQLPEQGPVAELLQNYRADVSALDQKACGAIILPALSLLSISATDIRGQIARGDSPRFLLPDLVWQYIDSKDLYR